MRGRGLKRETTWWLDNRMGGWTDYVRTDWVLGWLVAWLISEMVWMADDVSLRYGVDGG